MYNQRAVYIEILRSQSDVSHVSILFQLYDLPERSIDNGNGTTLKSNLICLSEVYKRALYLICLRMAFITQLKYYMELKITSAHHVICYRVFFKFNIYHRLKLKRARI